VTFIGHFGDPLTVVTLCVQLTRNLLAIATRNLLAIAKFLVLRRDAMRAKVVYAMAILGILIQDPFLNPAI